MFTKTKKFLSDHKDTIIATTILGGTLVVLGVAYAIVAKNSVKFQLSPILESNGVRLYVSGGQLYACIEGVMYVVTE